MDKIRFYPLQIKDQLLQMFHITETSSNIKLNPDIKRSCKGSKELQSHCS